ncbi:bifunctional hydroxymethylpyrimidine kinase/phosphomethylpyrimidine kinase [Suttonella ornithocola]|uniref:hydroxymethylpyrimidine kinase n=1 Tax=Suttonella ornithocola TaxID=279832 RepID=A0A380MSH0_9GAMM|nr:bifunctional hydroxymethylpyrimidine kinase/phosphomethylpyrimidine kinase [Suttonella ornithocola]SUO95505.1 Hydroxymethylpyrimidine/phosphomethylpyrimidine kinase [Suttonella ornithocola]
MIKTALTIAGSDSGGGADIQADLKTFSALGVYGMSVITAITAQNTCKVNRIDGLSLAVIRAQIETIFDDIVPSTIKIGVLGTTEVIQTVADTLAQYPNVVIVLDSVMVAKNGDAFLIKEAVDALKTYFILMVMIIAPNLPEAAVLLDIETPINANEKIAKALLNLGSQAVLLKDGHSQNAMLHDLLMTQNGLKPFKHTRHQTANTHGTGCTLSAAIAANLTKGQILEVAVEKAIDYLVNAIAQVDSLGIGHGYGPVHHFHQWWSA